MTLQPVQSPDDAAAAFRAALDRFDPARRPLILGHFDADGLAAVAILARMLDRADADYYRLVPPASGTYDVYFDAFGHETVDLAVAGAR